MPYKENKQDSPIAQHCWAIGPSIHALFTTHPLAIARVQISLAKTFSCTIEGRSFEGPILTWMESYSMRQKGPELPLDFSLLTPFTRKGLKAIGSIPLGEKASYGEIAAQLGCAKGARAIGNVCNKNPFPLIIPCHRVIQGNGALGGFAYCLEIKQELLAHES